MPLTRNHVLFGCCGDARGHFEDDFVRKAKRKFEVCTLHRNAITTPFSSSFFAKASGDAQ